ncbi:MAG: protein kinase [Candidatus Tectimicrobiota bacterium]
MGFFYTSKINRAINTLLTMHTADTLAASRASQIIQAYGPAAIPKLLAACTQTRHTAPVIKLLKTFVHDKTFPLFEKALASPHSRIVAATVATLAHSKAYNPNLLLALLRNPRVSRAAIKRLLHSGQRALAPQALLRALDTLSPQDRSVLLRLLPRIATAHDSLQLIQRLEHADDQVRLTCAHTLARFPSEDSKAAFYRLLRDPHPLLRLAALNGLERGGWPLHLTAVCKLFWDEDEVVRSELSKFLARGKDPQLFHHLFEILEDPGAPRIHTDIANLLASLRDSGGIQQAVATRPRPAVTREVLLRLLDAPQTSLRQVALLGLSTLESPFDIDRICPLLWDTDFQIRRLAVTVLTRSKAPQTLATLTRALLDTSEDVRQRGMSILNVIVTIPLLKALLVAINAAQGPPAEYLADILGHQGGPQLIHAALQLMADTDAFVRSTVRTLLQRTDDPTVVPHLTEALADSESWVRCCAMEVLLGLGDKGRDAVTALLDIVQAHEEDSALALEVLMKIGDPRAIPVCLRQVYSSPPAQHKLALQALAILTDAENFDVVLDSLLALRDTVAPDLKEHCYHAAARLLKRFPEQMVRRHVCTTLFPGTPQRGEPHLQTDCIRPISSLYTRGKCNDTVLDPAALMPGNILGERYQVIRQVGKGGFGSVVLVRDLIVKEDIVLKFLHPHLATDERMLQRFIQELRSARRITHEHVLRIHDLLPVENAYAISMEYFPSHNLSLDIANKQFLQDLRRGCQVLISICRGMATAHQAGVIHRDLKPPNVLIDDADLVKVADFGLAAMATERTTRLTSPGMMLGTPLYMAPEYIRNQPLDARADIYSLGVIMYEMCTGQTPYSGGDPIAILFQHVEGKAPLPRTLNPQLPAALEAVIRQAMAVDPSQRFQSMQALEASLLAALP